MLKCYIEGKNLVNGSPKVFDVAEGAVFVENYNETLDSGTIILPQLTSKIGIEPYDVVIIYSTDDSNCKIVERRMCVDTYICTQTSLDPTIYKYEITLFSETKLLEGILCPSLAITKLLNGQRKVLYYLQQYLNEYGTKIAVNSSTLYGTNKYSFSTRVQEKFNTIECPEMQWNEPTLREVFTDLMMVADCIPIIRDNVIDYIDISVIGSEITSNQRKGINYITESQSSQDYVSEIKMNAKQVINGDLPTGHWDDNDFPRTQTIVEKVGLKNEDYYLVTTDNCRLETTYPIWNLFSCNAYCYMSKKVKVYASLEDVSADIYEEKIFSTIVHLPLLNSSQSTNYVLEKSEWQTKDIYYGGFDTNIWLSSDYQNRCLYYVRGQKGIHNFEATSKGKYLFTGWETSVLELVLKYVAVYFQAQARDYYRSQGYFEVALFSDVDYKADWKEVSFEIGYETKDDCVFRISKEPFVSNNRYIVDNQTNAFINSDRQGLLEYLKAKRLGNKVKIINGRYKDNEVNIPSLAMKLDGSIIFRKEIAIFNNYITVNYQATDNYVLKDYYTSIKSKLRNWSIVGEEIFVREELIKFYVGNNVSSVSNANVIIPSYNTVDKYLEDFKYCAIQFETSDGKKPLDNGNSIKYEGNNYGIDRYMVECTKHKVGKSVVFTIKMPDNSIVGKYISGEGTGGREQKNAFYTDNNGEITGGTIWFFKTFNFSYTNVPKIALRPGISSASDISNVVAKIPFTLHKDNKEVLQISIQFEITDEATNMFLGKV